MTRQDLADAHHRLICCVSALEVIDIIDNYDGDVVGVVTCIRSTLK